jgi:hypothetical protein
MTTKGASVDLHQQLDTLSTLRVDHQQLPAQKLAAILQQLDPATAERVQAIVRECDDREAELTAAIAQQEAVIKAYVLETGAGAHGTYLQAIIMAPRITWDTKAMRVYSTLYPEVLAYRKVGEPSVQIRAHSQQRRP